MAERRQTHDFAGASQYRVVPQCRRPGREDERDIRAVAPSVFQHAPDIIEIGVAEIIFSRPVLIESVRCLGARIVISRVEPIAMRIM